MSDSAGLWIGAEGKKRGPYTEATLRQWMNEGKLDGRTLAWRQGMADWLPLATVLEQLRSAPQPPPVPSTSPAFGYNETTAEGMGAQAAAARRAKRERLPTPPSLHWGLVVLFSILSLGIFLIVWTFKQSSWVRKIDEQSRATGMLIASCVGYCIGSMMKDGGETTVVGMLLMLVSLVLSYVAYFSMGSSMRRKLPEYGLTPQIGTVTLLLFNVIYLQAQMSWVARWKTSGRSLPRPPKRVMYVLLLIPVALGFCAAITLPAYQAYVFRVQVMEGAVLADHLKDAASAYYERYGELPGSNAALGLKPGTPVTGRFVSNVRMQSGHVVVSYDNPATAEWLRDKVLVLTPQRAGGQLSWDCTSNSTVPEALLPAQCRE